MIKKLLSFMIICIVVFGIMNMTTYAQTQTVTSDAQVDAIDLELANKIKVLGVWDTSEYFSQNQQITRREMAKITVDYLNINAADATKTPFIDVAVGSDGFDEIAELYARGIITGSDALIFSPDRTITVNEALAFILNASGYAKVAAVKGGYPYGYHSIASENNFLNRLCHQGEQEADVNDILVMMDGMLQAPAASVRTLEGSRAEYELSKDRIVLNTLYSIYIEEGIVTANQYTALTLVNSKCGKNKVEIDGVEYRCTQDVSDLLGCAVEYYYYDDDVNDPQIYYISPQKSNAVLKIMSDDILLDQTTNSKIAHIADTGKTKTQSFEPDVDVIYNQLAYVGYGLIADIMPNDGWVELIDNDGDGSCEVIKVTDLKTVIVMNADTYEHKVVEKPHSDLSDPMIFDLDEQEYTVIYKNRDFSFDDIKPGMVLTIAESADASLKTVYVSEEKYTYTLECVQYENGKAIPILDGEEYEFVNGYSYESPVVGNAYTFFFDFLGRIAYIQTQMDESDWACGILSRVLSDKAKQQIIVEIYNAEGEFIRSTIDRKVTINNCVYQLHTNSMDEITTLLQGAIGGAIQFKINGEQYLKTLELPQKSTADETINLQILAEGDSLRVRNGMVAGEQGTFYMGNALIFSVPSDPNDVENYQVFDLTSMVQSGHNYINYNGTGNYDHYIPEFHYTAYANVIDGVSIPTANIVVLTNYHMDTNTTRFSDIYVVAENNMALNYDDEIVHHLVLYSNSNIDGLTAETVYYPNENINSTIDKIALQPGDVIIAGKNVQGEISRIEVIWRYQNDTNLAQRITDFTSCYNSGSGFDADSVIAYGNIKVIDHENSLIEYVTNVERNDWLAQINSSTVYLVVAENGRGKLSITRGSINDLTYDDTVIIRAKSAVASLIVILKDK